MKESEIRSDSLVDEYLRLSSLDSVTYFSGCLRQSLVCIACQSPMCELEFEKEGFEYSRCGSCRSLFMSPRPPAEVFDAFYREAPSSRFWSEVFFPSVAEKRRELIFAKRARLLQDLMRSKCLRMETIIDVGAGHGLFLEEWKKIEPASHVVAVEPSPEMVTIIKNKGIEVVEATAESLSSSYENSADLVVCFEVIEHCHDPSVFLRSLYKLARPGGCVVISGLGADGFDISVLGRHSKSVHPPHHINFLSVEGFRRLFMRTGFSGVDIRTPGELDVDIVSKRWPLFPELKSQNGFVDQIINSSESVRQNFQEFLKTSLLSSHVWVLGRK